MQVCGSRHMLLLHGRVYLSWLTKSKFVSLLTPLLASSATTSLACTSMTISALRILRCRLLSWPLTLFTTCIHGQVGCVLVE